MTLLGLFAPARRELGVVEAADLLGRPKSTVSRWMSAMEDAGFLDRDGATGRYRIGMRLAALGELARQATSLQRVAFPALERLAKATGETANLVALAGSEAVNLELVESPRPIKHVGWLGRRLPLHATAAGKALVAWRAPDEVDAMLERPLRRFTPATITDAAELVKDLALVRQNGYAVAWAEFEEDLLGLAAPVHDHTGTVVGALTISAPLARVPRPSLEAVAARVVNEAATVSEALGFQPDAVR